MGGSTPGGFTTHRVIILMDLVPPALAALLCYLPGRHRVLTMRLVCRTASTVSALHAAEGSTLLCNALLQHDACLLAPASSDPAMQTAIMQPSGQHDCSACLLSRAPSAAQATRAAT